MTQTKWRIWVEANQKELSQTAKRFIKDATLHEVKENTVTFTLRDGSVTFRKLSASSWTMPSSLFVPYGSLSDLFKGFNLLLEDN